jgi:hypothetical protein
VGVYPGDGYGGVNVTQRREVLLPAGSPAPADFDQLVSLGDATGDGKPDFLAVVGGDLWAFTGYTGATVTPRRARSAPAAGTPTPSTPETSTGTAAWT